MKIKKVATSASPQPPTQPPQVAASSLELERLTLEYLTLTSARSPAHVQVAAIRGIGYALLALLRFLRETEAKDG